MLKPVCRSPVFTPDMCWRPATTDPARLNQVQLRPSLNGSAIRHSRAAIDHSWSVDRLQI
jgi:hypothetical protein